MSGKEAFYMAHTVNVNIKMDEDVKKEWNGPVPRWDFP